MRRQNPLILFRRRSIGILASALFVVLGSLQVFDRSASTAPFPMPGESNLTVGKLAFSSLSVSSAQQGNVTVADSDGSDGVPAFSSSFGFIASQPAWSPDGTKLVASVNNGDILLSPGTNLTNTGSVSESNASWSVTGKIAYERSSQIWTMNENGSGQAQFTAITRPSPTGPSWSPDGLKLAFSSGGDIWVINADGTNQVQLTAAATIDVDPAWSPDGSKIIFGRGGAGLATIDSNGTNLTPLTALNDSVPAFSPDGTKIAYVSGGSSTAPSGVYVMDANGANVAMVKRSSFPPFPLATLSYSNPAWQPIPTTPNTFSINGRVTHSGDGVAGATVDLRGSINAVAIADEIGNFQFSGLAPGGNYTVSPGLRRYYFTPANQTFNNLSANRSASFDVQSLCFSGQCVKNGKIGFTRGNDIFLVLPNGLGEANITNSAESEFTPSFGGDGSVLYAGSVSGNSEIFKKSAIDAPPVNITNNSGNDVTPSHSYDDKSIAFTSGRDGNDEVYRMNSDGSNQVRLTNTPSDNESFPAFSPDGYKIVYSMRLSGQSASRSLWIMNSDGSDQHLIFTMVGPSAAVSRPSFSPDGSKIIFNATADASSSIPVTWIMNADGSAPGQFGGGIASQGTYSPDGLNVAYICCVFDNNFPNLLRTVGASGSSSSSMILNYNTQKSAPDWQPIAAPRPTAFDFDGDSRADISVFQHAGGFWHQARSGGGVVSPQWGIATDVLTPADYDGDMKTDIAVWRESDATFYALNSFDLTVRIEQFGITGDVPTGGDFDGDGKADIAVYRPGAQSFFYYRASMGNPQGNITSIPWGTTGDKPVVGDFDGDARTDAGVFRGSENTWFIRKSSNGQLLAAYFGAATDLLIPADYDGDGRTDIAVFRTGIWYLLRSSLGFAAFQWGQDKDIPAPADYDGDGRADPAIYRQGTWWILKSSSGAEGHPFGGATDKPIPSAYVR
jgi:Tol biopolymer transport system component